MCGFITKSGTVYTLDTVNSTICGGKFKYPVRFSRCESTLIGCRPVFYLTDGEILRTSEIIQYI